MDILAHALWGGAIVSIAYKDRSITRSTLLVTTGLAVWPDIAHTLPLIAWWFFGDGTWAALVTYALASPGQEPVMPSSVALWSHHMHCIGHSAIVAIAVTLFLWAFLRSFWIPLIGWGSHILIDVFTHSQDYYAVPVLYPITERGFDGIAWNTPWFIALNYAAILTTYLWLWRAKRFGKHRPSGIRKR